MNYVAVRKYKDGGEQVCEYFNSHDACLTWIQKQPQPKDDSWQWMIGNYKE